MKKLNWVLIIVFVVSMVLSACGSGSNSPATNNNQQGSSQSDKQNSGEKIKLSFGHTLSESSPYHVLATKFKESIEAKTNGQITVEIFPSSQLGGEVQMIQAARTGSQDILISAQAPLENTVKEWKLFSMAYLFKDLDQANKVLQSPVGQKFLDMLPDYDLVGLGWLSAIERNVFGNKEINSVADMKGLKIRVMQSPGQVKSYEGLGANPTPMAYSELYLALQQGVVDAADTSPDQMVGDKFAEVSKYYNLTKAIYLPAALIISKTTWDKLSPDLQQKVKEATQEAIQAEIDVYKEQYQKGLDDMKKMGVKVVDVNVDEFQKATESVRQELLKDIPNGQQLYEEVQNAK